MRFLALLYIFIFTSISFGQVHDNDKCRALYNQEKWQDAYDCYAADSKNLFSVYMSAYLAKFLDNKKDYKMWSKRLMKDEFNSSESFYYAAYLFPANSKKYLKTINKGLKKYTKDTTLLSAKADYYIAISDHENGIPVLEEIISISRWDLPFYVKAGNLYHAVHKPQMAIPYYEKGLSVDAKNYDCNSNLGIIYHDMASDLIVEMNKTEETGDKEKMQKEAKSLLKRAMPYLKIAYELNTSNKDLKSALLTCYSELDMIKEYNALMQS